MKLDVCIIATVRPEVLRMTLQSFTKNLLNQFDCRAIINVDPAGETENHTQMDVVDLCREYFSEVKYRTPESPSFAGAVKWAWQQVETDLFFHLEDDWIITEKVGAEILNNFDDAAVVWVSAGYRKYKNTHYIKRKIADGVFSCHSKNMMQSTTFYLGPSFMRNSYFKAMANVMELDKDPEFQYGREPSKLITHDYPKPIFFIVTHAIIINGGRKWRRAIRLGNNRSGGDIWQLKQKSFWYAIEWTIKWRICKLYWQMRYCK